MEQDQGQGNPGTSLFTWDLRQPAGVWNGDIFTVLDNVGTCGWNNGGNPEPLTLNLVDEVRFARNKEGKQTLSIFARHGTRPMTKTDVEACMQGTIDFEPPTKRYRIDFVFDGRTYKPTPASARAMRVFAEQ
jgi:hypothetical protein